MGRHLERLVHEPEAAVARQPVFKPEPGCLVPPGHAEDREPRPGHALGQGPIGGVQALAPLGEEAAEGILCAEDLAAEGRVLHRCLGNADMSDDANQRPGDTRASGENSTQDNPRAYGHTGPDRGEDPAAGTADEPVQPGELQSGDRSDLAQALGGPVDIALGHGRRSSQGPGKNIFPSDANMAARAEIGDRPDPDEEVDLVVSLATVVGIIDGARAVGELEEEATNEEVQDPEVQDEVDPDGLAGSVKGLIDDLNEDEQAALIALTWIGRGDYDASEWKEVLRLAKERNEGGDAAEYLTNMELFGDYLSEGVAAFGYLAEQVAR
jgi:hypothetical protein